MKLSDFDYELPAELIAQRPAARRDESRLLVLDRATGDIRETLFGNFPRFLQEGDVLAVNETKVIPARIFGARTSGGEVEILLVRRLKERQWLALLRPSKRIRAGEIVFVGDERLSVRVGERHGPGEWRLSLPEEMPERAFLERHGHVPLPPYIKRRDEADDRERYQTIFARREGSVAAPTAGLHFTDDLIFAVKRRGVTVVPITLHVGPGTFRPLQHETVEQNRLDPEIFVVKKKCWDEIREAREARRRIVAVGTTTTRILEALAAGATADIEEHVLDGEPAISGTTDLFIHPGFDFRIVGSLLTNLHLPRSSLLVLAAAFAGRERILTAYRWAIGRRFRFYSYGDAMLIR